MYGCHDYSYFRDRLQLEFDVKGTTNNDRYVKQLLRISAHTRQELQLTTKAKQLIIKPGSC